MERKLRQIVSESVRKVIKENYESEEYDDMDFEEYGDDMDFEKYDEVDNPYDGIVDTNYDVYTGDGEIENEDENREQMLSTINNAMSHLDAVIGELNKGDGYVMGASELRGLAYDAKVLLYCIQCGIANGQVPEKLLHNTFGEHAMSYIP